MAQVVIQINGRNYTMQCDDGQEEHLRALARTIDAEITNIRTAVGQLGDLRLLIMASLVIADRLFETERKMADMEEQMQGLRAVSEREHSRIEAVENQAAGVLDGAALRLETLARTAASFITEPPATDAGDDAAQDESA